jgi:hypothetical protein
MAEDGGAAASADALSLRPFRHPGFLMRLPLFAPPRRSALLAVLALVIAPTIATALKLEPKPDDDGTYRLYLQGWVDVSATGELSGYDVEKPKELAAEIRDGVLKKLNAQGVVPVQHEGRPVALRSWLEVGVRLTPSTGDRYTLAVERVTLAPRAKGHGGFDVLALPYYPRSYKCWNGTVTASFTVLPNGRVDGMTTTRTGDVWPSFASGLAQRSILWRFEPETIDGVPVASPMQIVYVFNGWGREPPEVPETLAWALSAESAERHGLAAVLADKSRGPVPRLMATMMSSGEVMPDARIVKDRCGKLP